MSHIYIPAASADQWAAFLAEPTKHWRTGYSARTLAYSWQEANGFPLEIATSLATSEFLRGSELLLAIPEHKVALPGGGRPSQNDIWALAKSENALVSIAVEGKVAEPFGPTVGEWLEQASAGKSKRLAFLKAELGIDEVPSTVRYQLLHRTASALLEARRFGASHAVMLVHSFSHQHLWYEDFVVFAALLGAGTPARDIVISVGNRNGVHLHIGWVYGNSLYLSK